MLEPSSLTLSELNLSLPEEVVQETLDSHSLSELLGFINQAEGAVKGYVKAYLLSAKQLLIHPKPVQLAIQVSTEKMQLAEVLSEFKFNLEPEGEGLKQFHDFIAHLPANFFHDKSWWELPLKGQYEFICKMIERAAKDDDVAVAFIKLFFGYNSQAASPFIYEVKYNDLNNVDYHRYYKNVNYGRYLSFFNSMLATEDKEPGTARIIADMNRRIAYSSFDILKKCGDAVQIGTESLLEVLYSRYSLVYFIVNNTPISIERAGLVRHGLASANRIFGQNLIDLLHHNKPLLKKTLTKDVLDKLFPVPAKFLSNGIIERTLTDCAFHAKTVAVVLVCNNPSLFYSYFYDTVFRDRFGFNLAMAEDMRQSDIQGFNKILSIPGISNELRSQLKRHGNKGVNATLISLLNEHAAMQASSSVPAPLVVSSSVTTSQAPAVACNTGVRATTTTRSEGTNPSWLARLFAQIPRVPQTIAIPVQPPGDKEEMERAVVLGK